MTLLNEWKQNFAMAADKDSSSKSTKFVHERVGKKLKQVYADVAAEPIPDRFLDLIKQLESDNSSETGKDLPEKQPDRS
jgi:hypothetical protein